MAQRVSRRTFLKSAGLAAVATLLPVGCKAAQKRQPNVVLIYADDLGSGDVYTNTELGNDSQAQLYNLKDDLGEKQNLAAERPATVREMAALLAKIRSDRRSRNP